MDLLDPKIEKFWYTTHTDEGSRIVLCPGVVGNLGDYPVAKQVVGILQEFFVPPKERGNAGSTMMYGDYAVDAEGTAIPIVKRDRYGNVIGERTGWRQGSPGACGAKGRYHRPPISDESIWLKLIAGSLALGPRHLPAKPDPDVCTLDCILFDIDLKGGQFEHGEPQSSLDFPSSVRERYLRPVLTSIAEVFGDLGVSLELTAWSSGGSGWWAGVWFDGPVKLGLVQTLHSLVVEKARRLADCPIQVQRSKPGRYVHVQPVVVAEGEPYVMIDRGNTAAMVCRAPGGYHNHTGRRGRFLSLVDLSNIEGFIDPLLSIRRSVSAKELSTALTSLHLTLKSKEEAIQECGKTKNSALHGNESPSLPLAPEIEETDPSVYVFGVGSQSGLGGSDAHQKTRLEDLVDPEYAPPPPPLPSSISTTLRNLPELWDILDEIPVDLDGCTHDCLILGGYLARMVRSVANGVGVASLIEGRGLMLELREMILGSQYREHPGLKREQRAEEIDYNIHEYLFRLANGLGLGYDRAFDHEEPVREMAASYAQRIQELGLGKEYSTVTQDHIERFLLTAIRLWKKYGTIRYTHDEWAAACGYVSRTGRVNPKQQLEERKLMECFVDSFGGKKTDALMAPLLVQIHVGAQGRRSEYQSDWSKWHEKIAEHWGGRGNWRYDPTYLRVALRRNGWLTGKDQAKPIRRARVRRSAEANKDAPREPASDLSGVF